MRQLTTGGRAARGLTLIELMATLAIGAILLGMAAPYLSDYITNTRLREGGNALLAETLYAQAEAIKRNASTRLTVSGSTVTVLDMSTGGANGTVLRTRLLSDNVGVANAAQVNFGSRGTPVPFGTAVSIDLLKTGVTCSAELRCPGLRIDGGGGVRLCGNQLDCS